MMNKMAGNVQKNIETIYPLSPMQQGMLFHTIYEPDSSIYFEQLHFKLKGPLDVEPFKKALQRVIERHPVLRTSFVWKKTGKMMQVVHKEIDLPLETLDWRQYSNEEQHKHFRALLQKDRQRGFNLNKAPLLRMTLIQLDDDAWRVIWSNHHIILDGWSNPILLKEIFTLYEGLRNGQDIPLPRARPYRDYVAWLQKQDKNKAETYWRELLGDFSAPTPLTVDKPVKEVAGQTSDHASLHLELDREAGKQLQKLAKQHNLTVNTLVQGAWAYLLHRYSGEDDVVIGVTVSGRPPEIQGVESMVGLFINTLPMRIEIDENQKVMDWLKSIQNQSVALRDFEYSSLAEVQRLSNLESNNPLFNSIVVFENYPVDRSLQEQKGSLQIEDFGSYEQTNFPLTLVAAARGDSVVLEFKYDTGRFDASTIERTLQHLANLLQGMAAQPQRPLLHLPLMTPGEKEQIVNRWKDVAESIPKNETIHQLIESQAEQRPDQTAISMDGQSLSYDELNRQANQLAHYLMQNGAGAGQLIGVYMDRSPQLIVALLAVLKTGAAYLPMDPVYPKERLDFMLRDANVPIVIADSGLSAQLPETDARIIRIDELSSRLQSMADSNPQTNVQPDDLIYVIYTSGSTGNPKGTLISHYNVVRLLRAAEPWFGFDENDVWTFFHSYAFDFSVWEIWGALSYGGRVVVVPYMTSREPSEFYRLLIDEKVTVLNQTPSAFQTLMRAEEDINPPQDDLSLRYVIFGGEALELSTLRPWMDRRGDQNPQLINMYGITETTVHVTYRPINRSDVDEQTGSMIGRPIPDLQIYLLDAYQRPVPDGIPGEICVAGAGLAHGYLNRPGLTSEKFIANPFAVDGQNQRLYRSGDLARFNADGDLEYLGRMDNQVQLRGFRVELGEIEAALNRFPAVRESLVTVHQDGAADQRLIAYLVIPDQQSPPLDELRDHLRQSLPEYMIPAAFIPLKAFPLTANGKIDRRALPSADEGQHLTGAEPYTAPRNQTEDLLAGIWSAILQREQIGIHDNFFDLGGHSLLATQLASRIRDAFEVELSLRELFEQPTIAHIAAKIETLRQSDQGSALPPLKPVERPQYIPASFAQQRLWFLDQLAGGSSFYNIPAALRLKGELNVNILQKSINTLIERHEALRTHFAEREGEPVQVIDPPFTIDLQPTDLTSLPDNDKQDKAYQLASAEALQPFDLNTGPLLRVRLIRLHNDEHVIIFTLHHTVTDGWSMGVLVREVITLYQAYQADKPNPLPDLNVQYADYAIWQRNWLQGETLDKELEFWKNEIGVNPPVLELPTDHPRPAMQTFNGRTIDYTLPADLQSEIHRFNQKQGVTLFMTMMGAFQTLMHRYSGQDILQVGSPIANRTQSETEAIIGFFVNTLIFQADFSDNPDFRNFLKQVRERTLGIYAHQHLPFEQLVEVLQPERDMSHAPLFQVAFILQNAPMDKMEIPGLTAEPFHHENKTAKYDLTVYSMEYEDGIGLSFEYNTDLFEEQTIRRMQQHFENLLRAVITEPRQKISAVNFLSPEEQQTMLWDWNDTASDYPNRHTVHQLFETWAKEQPEAIAAGFEDQTWTYRELNQKANRLARYLQQQGVGADTLVGISLPRSLDIPLAMLGILKAGGAFLPIDPAYPEDRIRYMMEDSGAAAVITHSGLTEQLPDTNVPFIALDQMDDNLASLSGQNLTSNTNQQNLAYVIYTSGSTGKPKGTMLPHQGLCNLSRAQRKAFTISPERRILQFASLSFDASVWETVMALLNGAALILAKQEDLTSGQGLAKVMKTQKINTVTLPPSVLAVMPEVDLPDLKTIITAGEKCTTDLVQRWGHGRQFVNAYGPTETSVCASMFEADPRSDQTPPIGKPVDNFQLYILDRAMQPVPVGVPGELHIAGDGLARGYLKRPDLTAEKFIPNPFVDAPGARMYKSGDLVHYLPDGNIEFLGRIDHQVKVRGFRIELGEIEAAIGEREGIRDVVVLAREDEPGDQRLAAYIVQDNDAGHTSGSMREALAKRLPDYMIPSAFVFLDEMPLTPNGKVDRKALPAPDLSREALESPYEAPRNKNEEAVADIVAGLLKMDKVGIHDNFFALGGHSLLATRFIARIKDHFNVELPLRALFESPTVAAIAENIEQLQAAPPKSEESAIEHEERSGDELQDLLKDLEGMSDDEALSLLDDENRDEDEEDDD